MAGIRHRILSRQQAGSAPKGGSCKAGGYGDRGGCPDSSSEQAQRTHKSLPRRRSREGERATKADQKDATVPSDPWRSRSFSSTASPIPREHPGNREAGYARTEPLLCPIVRLAFSSTVCGSRPKRNGAGCTKHRLSISHMHSVVLYTEHGPFYSRPKKCFDSSRRNASMK